MKKIIFAVSLLIGIGFSVMAQTPSAGKGSKQDPSKPKLTPEEKAAKLTAYMTSELSLTADQQTKVAVLNTTNSKQVSEIRKKHKGNMEAAKPELKPLKEKYNTDLKAILTPEQNTKWTELKKKKREEMKANKEAAKVLEDNGISPEDLD